MPLHAHGASIRNYGTAPESYALILAECDFYMRRPLWFMILSGVFERHHGLRLVFAEQRAAWVVPTLRDLDSIYDFRRAGLREIIPRRPSEYFASNCYIGASFMSRAECDDRDIIGVDRMMWGSDYPHMEGTWPYTAPSLRSTFAGVPLPEMKAMLGLNAVQLYALDRDALDAVAARIGPTAHELSIPLSGADIPQGAEATWAFRRNGAWS
jgi:hypothetical protein